MERVILTAREVLELYDGVDSVASVRTGQGTSERSANMNKLSPWRCRVVSMVMYYFFIKWLTRYKYHSSLVVYIMDDPQSPYFQLSISMDILEPRPIQLAMTSP